MHKQSYLYIFNIINFNNYFQNYHRKSIEVKSHIVNIKYFKKKEKLCRCFLILTRLSSLLPTWDRFVDSKLSK